MSRAVTPILAVALLTLAVAAPLGATLFGAAASGAAPACTITYTGGDVGDPLNWDLADNWSPAGPPGPADYACIPASFGWRWSPESKAAARAAGSDGSATARSKSTTPSKAPLVLIQALAAWRRASAVPL